MFDALNQVPLDGWFALVAWGFEPLRVKGKLIQAMLVSGLGARARLCFGSRWLALTTGAGRLVSAPRQTRGDAFAARGQAVAKDDIVPLNLPRLELKLEVVEGLDLHKAPKLRCSLALCKAGPALNQEKQSWPSKKKSFEDEN